MGEENARLLSEKECPPTARAAGGHSFSLIVVVFNLLTHFSFRILFVCYRLLILFKSNVRETWRVILVSEADIFFTESLRILAERLSQSETQLPLRQICYYSPPEEVGVFSTEINAAAHAPYVSQPILLQLHISIRSNALYSFLFSDPPYHTTRKETLQKN